VPGDGRLERNPQQDQERAKHAQDHQGHGDGRGLEDEKGAGPDARRSAPACRSITVVLVGGDGAVDNAVTADLVARWRRAAGVVVDVHEFPSTLHLNHDVVDPEQVGGRPSVTYPVLLRAITMRK
jgi:hypothetical protein